MSHQDGSKVPFDDESSERFFLESEVPSAVLTADDHRFVAINDAFTEAFGYGREAVVGDTFAEAGFFAGDPFEEDQLLDSSSGNVVGRKGYVRRQDGDVREVILIKTSLETGTRPLLVCQLIDISHWQFIGQEFLLACENDLERIGHTLRENISQRLAGITLMCQSVLQDIDDNQRMNARDALRGIRDHVKQTNREIEEAVSRLQPVGLTGESLGKALQMLGEEIEQMYDVPCFTAVEEVSIETGAVAINLYRIAHRAAESAAKHGNAEDVRIELQRTEEGVVLTIQSSGSSLTREALEGGQYGLDIMRYRARVIRGRLEIDDDPETGTTTVRCIQPDLDELFARDRPETEVVDT